MFMTKKQKEAALYRAHEEYQTLITSIPPEPTNPEEYEEWKKNSDRTIIEAESLIKDK